MTVYPRITDTNFKAIETRYRGYRFRSRTEARWAVFFDAVGYEWTYEEQGYTFADGTNYLPDFCVCDGDSRRFFVEVKADSAQLTLPELRKLLLLNATTCERVFLADGIPDFRMYYSAVDIVDRLDDQFDDYVVEGWDVSRSEYDWAVPLVASGQLPVPAWYIACAERPPEHPNATKRRLVRDSLRAGDASGIQDEDVRFVNTLLSEPVHDRCGWALHSYKDRPWADEHVNFWREHDGCSYYTAETVDAIGYARSARFEHGERPFCAPAW